MKCWWVVLMAAMVVGCSDGERGKQAEVRPVSEMDTPTTLHQPRTAANIFYSGHSLMDQPLPDFVQKIAESLSTQVQWNRQYVVGSSIRRRTRGGDDPALPEWHGYKQGYNREGEGLDVVAELRGPQTIAGKYDVLVITEEHTMLETLIKSDTVRLLRQYHDQFVAANAAGQTFFYEPWFSVADKSEPRSWIEYERRAAPIWQCVATRINVSLQAEGRADRIISLPASTALAALIERATQGAGMPALTRSTVRETVDSLIRDDVHLQPLGAYYMSLVTYASIYRRSPQGAWHPTTVSPEQATALQDFAWTFVSRYYDAYRPLSLEECRARLASDDGLEPLWHYINTTYWRKDVGAVRGYLRYVRRLMTSRRLFSSDTAENPFYFDPAADNAYWLAPPQP